MSEKTIRLLFFGWGLIPLLAILSWWIPPSDFILFQWLGLLMPFITAISLILFVIVIVKKYWSFPMLIIYLIGFVWYWPLVFQWSPFHKNLDSSDLMIKIASYNVHNMQAEYGLSSLSRVSNFMFDEQVELLFLQEVPSDYGTADFLKAFDGMNSIVISEDEYDSESRLVILSKYPLQRLKTLSHIDRPHYAMFASLNYNGKNLNVVNCHLQTTSWNQVGQSISPFVGTTIDKISDNYLRRELQTNSIRDFLLQVHEPVILVGDFNDSPISYTYSQLKANLSDAFQVAGNGYGGTYRYLGGLYRIDYIFFDNKYFKAFNYRAAEIDYSDHLPILTDLKLTNK